MYNKLSLLQIKLSTHFFKYLKQFSLVFLFDSLPDLIQKKDEKYAGLEILKNNKVLFHFQWKIKGFFSN